MGMCGGRPIEFNEEIGEQTFDAFLIGLYTDKAKARAIRLLSRYTWGDSQLPDKYKQMANEIDGLGWNDEKKYGIDCKKEEEFDVSIKYERAHKEGLTENARSYFAHRLDNGCIHEDDDSGNLELLAIEAIMDGKSDLGINALIHLGVREIRGSESWNSPPADFLKAALVAKKSGKDNLAADIFKGLLTHYEETAYDFFSITAYISILDVAQIILEDEGFQKAGFADKMEKYGLLSDL